MEMGVTGNMPWKAMPDQMCRYRSTTQLVRSYFPQLALGLRTNEEMDDVEEPKNITPQIEKLDTLLSSSPTPVVQNIAQDEQKRRGRPRKNIEETVVTPAEIVDVSEERTTVENEVEICF
jgi:hypothetical protein